MLDVQQQANTDTRNRWDSWSSLRKMHTEIWDKLSVSHKPLSGRALLLGAGNGNDVDIQKLESLFDEIVIVDIDPDALNCFMEKVKQPDKFKSMQLDLTGFANQVPDLKNMSEPEIIGLINTLKPNSELASLTGKFDFIMGCNYTTQLIGPKFMMHNQQSGSTYVVAVNQFTVKVLENIFYHLRNLLKDDGLLLHSTDTFEMHTNSATGYSSPATKPIMEATKGDLSKLSEIVPVFGSLAAQSLTISGSVMTTVMMIGLEFKRLFIIPWHFQRTATIERIYINFLTAFTKK
ncbi:hypothetical protein AB4Z50_35535 [Paenibacillus sp. 2TAB26]|uniref:hypothetical protein n=1 Tax=Paenibacillus sp. 2TAB26 TaxID=3233005 RepID=UPI003F983C88